MATGIPTQIAEEAGVSALAASAASAANKMEAMLDTLAAEFQPGSTIFDIPEIDVDAWQSGLYGTANDGVVYTELGSQVQTLDALAASYADTVKFDVPAVPTVPDVEIATLITAPTIPALNAVLPEINIGTAPSINIPSTPVAPNIQDIVTPDAPVLSIPSVPELTDIVLPSISSISIPLFTETFPEVPADLLAPDEVFFYEEPPYTSDELVALRNLLVDDLDNGGWGVTHADEEALFDREVDRISNTALSDETSAIETMASRGFEIPTGALVALLRKGQQNTLNKLSEANRDISIERAELIRKAREFSVTSSLTLNQTMVTHFGFVQQRLLSAAQSVVDFALRTFNTEAELYNIRVKAYQSYANAYELRIRAQLTQLEAEKAQLEAESLKIGLNKAQIQAYTAQVQAISLTVQIFNTQLQSAKIKSDIERNKLQVFSAQISAHRSSIDAEIAKVSAFSAEVSAETSRVQLYKTQVDAHESEVRAVALVSDIEVKRAGVELEVQRTRLSGYQAEIAGFNAQLQAQETNTRIDIAKIDGAGRLASASADVNSARADISIATIQEANKHSTNVINLAIEEQKARALVATSVVELKTKALVQPAEKFLEFYQALGAYTSIIDVNI